MVSQSFALMSFSYSLVLSPAWFPSKAGMDLLGLSLENIGNSPFRSLAQRSDSVEIFAPSAKKQEAAAAFFHHLVHSLGIRVAQPSDLLDGRSVSEKVLTAPSLYRPSESLQQTAVRLSLSPFHWPHMLW